MDSASTLLGSLAGPLPADPFTAVWLAVGAILAALPLLVVWDTRQYHRKPRGPRRERRR